MTSKSNVMDQPKPLPMSIFEQISREINVIDKWEFQTHITQDYGLFPSFCCLCYTLIALSIKSLCYRDVDFENSSLDF